VDSVVIRVIGEFNIGWGFEYATPDFSASPNGMHIFTVDFLWCPDKASVELESI